MGALDGSKRSRRWNGHLVARGNHVEHGVRQWGSVGCMLKLSTKIKREGAGSGPHRSASLSVGAFTERPAVVIRNCLTEMVAIGQCRSADRYRSGVYGFDPRGLIRFAVEQSQFVCEFLFKLTLHFGDSRGDTLVYRHVDSGVAHQTSGFNARPGLQRKKCTFDVAE